MAEIGFMQSPGLGLDAFADGHRLERQVAGILHDGEVGFKGAGGRDEIHHFLMHIDVWHGHHSLAVGIRMAWIIDHLGGAKILFDAGYLHGLRLRSRRYRSLVRIEDIFEDDLLAAVGSPVGPSRGLHVCDILRDDLHANPLGVQGGCCAAGSWQDIDHKSNQAARPVMARRRRKRLPVISCVSSECAKVFLFSCTSSFSNWTVFPSRFEEIAVESTANWGCRPASWSTLFEAMACRISAAKERATSKRL